MFSRQRQSLAKYVTVVVQESPLCHQPRRSHSTALLRPSHVQRNPVSTRHAFFSTDTSSYPSHEVMPMPALSPVSAYIYSCVLARYDIHHHDDV